MRLSSESKEEQSALLSNCSEVMLRLGHYRLALRDASKACNLNPSNAKALERRSKAWLGLGLADSALEDVDRAVKLRPTSKTALSLKKGITARLTSDKGQDVSQFDFDQLLHESNRLRESSVNKNFGMLLPDVHGPVEVRESPGRGRGLFATRRISAGSLVLAEKALAVVFDDDFQRLYDVKEIPHSSMISHSQRFVGLTRSERTWRMMQICCENPAAAEAVAFLLAATPLLGAAMRHAYLFQYQWMSSIQKG